MKFESIKPGMTLYSVERTTVGNIKATEEVVYEVYIISVGDNEAIVSWNGNTGAAMGAWRLTKLRPAPPEWVKGSCFRDGVHCHVCRAKRDAGHRSTCTHPKAVAARLKAAKRAPSL